MFYFVVQTNFVKYPVLSGTFDAEDLDARVLIKSARATLRCQMHLCGYVYVAELKTSCVDAILVLITEVLIQNKSAGDKPHHIINAKTII